MKAYMLIIVLLSVVMTLVAQNPWQEVSSAGVTLRYRISTDGMYLENQLSATATGWISVGFRASNQMQDANIIIGYVTGTETLSIRDDWGTGTQTHASDTSLGGTDNLMETSGTQSGGVTTLNFTIPMNSGDTYDRIMNTGTPYQIILAMGQSDNYTSSHIDAGFANISINPPVGNDDEVLPVNSHIRLTSYPNPFNPQTTLKWDLPADTEAGLQIFNMKGQLVFTLPKTIYQAGSHTFTWNGTDNQGRTLPGGSYYTKLISPIHTQTLKIIMLK